MERNIWVINTNKLELLDIQNTLNKTGSLRTYCVTGVRTIDSFLKRFDEVRPSVILIDYDNQKSENFKTLNKIKSVEEMSGIPIGFVASRRTDDVLDECYDKGAIFVFNKPLWKNDVKRISRAAWQHENMKQYESLLLKQSYELKTAREIKKLNEQLKSRNEILHKIFGRYFSSEIVERILDKPDGATIGGEKKCVTVMMADLRGFTALSEGIEADVITDIVNNFLEKMTEVIYKYNGSVIEFMGDAILAVFGAPMELKNQQADAVAAAIEMQNTMSDVNYYNLQKGYSRIEMGIGIHYGEAFIGNIGSEKMMRYNIMGTTVNLCSRIENYSVGGQILISERLFEILKDDIDITNTVVVDVKGISSSVRIYDVCGIHNVHHICLDRLADEDCIPLKKEINVQLNLMEGKTIIGKSYIVTVKAMSNQYILIETDGNIDIYADVEIVKHNSRGYAKVMWKKENQYFLRCTSRNILKVGYEEVIGVEKERVKIESLNGNLVLRYGNDVNLCVSDEVEYYFIKCTSTTKKVRALEMLNYVIDESGIEEGNEKIATAKVSKVMLDVYLNETGDSGVTDYFEKKIADYFENTVILDTSEKDIDVTSMKKYRKKQIPWAVVKSTDIAAKGSGIVVKCLENTTGTLINTSEDTYIMIGIKGEVYDIKKEKFDLSYELSEEKLDIFEKMMDFIPSVEIGKDGNAVMIDELARICYPKNNNYIYAKQLDKRTKVFGTGARENYFLGRKGDYLAVRPDDTKDAYIIKGSIFADTYEPIDN